MKIDDPKSYIVDYSGSEKQHEIWKDIDRYQGYYQISNLGRIKSLARTVTYSRYQYQTQKYIQVNQKVKESIIKPGIHSDFYWNVPLTKDGSTTIYLVHVLLAKAFLPNPTNLPCVNHKDGNKRNCRLSNLEWSSFSYNNIHAVRSGLRSQNIPVMCVETGVRYESMSDADRQLELVEGSCWSAVHHETKCDHYSFILVDKEN